MYCQLKSVIDLPQGSGHLRPEPIYFDKPLNVSIITNSVYAAVQQYQQIP